MKQIVKTSGSQKGSPAAAEEGGEGRREGGGGGEKVSASEVDVGVVVAKSEIKVERRRGHG